MCVCVCVQTVNISGDMFLQFSLVNENAYFTGHQIALYSPDGNTFIVAVS